MNDIIHNFEGLMLILQLNLKNPKIQFNYFRNFID